MKVRHEPVSLSKLQLARRPVAVDIPGAVNVQPTEVVELLEVLGPETLHKKTTGFFEEAAETLSHLRTHEAVLQPTDIKGRLHRLRGAAALFGFYPLLPENADEVDHYHPEREAMAESAMGVSPAWFGDPLNGLNELGQHIAEDPIERSFQ